MHALFSFSNTLSVLLAAQAPLKPKTPRGTKTPINRNQISQSRVSSLGVLPAKRVFEPVSIGLLVKYLLDIVCHALVLSHLQSKQYVS